MAEAASSTTSSPSTTATASSSLPGITTTIKSMPKITGTATTESYSITFTPIVPVNANSNPFIHLETLPSGLVFIAVGSALALLLLALIITRVIMFCLSSKRAKNALEESDSIQQAFDYDPSLFNYKTYNSRPPSVYSLNSSSTLNLLGSNASLDQLASKNAGRSYRNAVSRSRNSLFISPTEMLAMPKMNEPSFYGYDSWQNSPIDSPQTLYSGSSKTDTTKVSKKSRPPSVFMEKLLDDDESSSFDDSSYDSQVHEKV